MTRARTPDPDKIVANHWPLDRRSHDHLRTAIATAAELVRYANHVTLDNPDTTMEFAGELYAVVGTVAGLLERMPQLLRQISNRTFVLADDPTLRHTRGDDPEAVMIEAATLLHKASSLMGASMDAARKAHTKLTWVGHR